MSAGDWSVEGKVALVTGASRGIGRAIAVRLAEMGARVACVATRAENCSDTVSACLEHTEGAAAYGVDVSSTDEVAELVKEVQSELGGIDILVNNAGITQDQLLLRMTEDDFDRVVDVNLKGSWNFLKAAARPLMKSGGRVINISSVVGVTGNAGQANYAASKAGVIGLTRSVAKELAGRGVCVNAVAPGFIETQMTAAIPTMIREASRRMSALSQGGEPRDVAELALFLASPGAVGLTGGVFRICGGHIAGA